MRFHKTDARETEPFGLDDAACGVFRPFPLAGGHPLRRKRCRLCGSLLGGQPVRVVTIAHVSEVDCVCDCLPVWAWLICGSHPVDNLPWLMARLTRIAADVHEREETHP